MAKKRAETVKPAPGGSRVLVHRREPTDDDLYDVGSWRGVPHFMCRHCAFDTLVASNMLAHLDGCKGAGSVPVNTVSEVEDNGNSG
jgi:hypothetical protein